MGTNVFDRMSTAEIELNVLSKSTFEGFRRDCLKMLIKRETSALCTQLTEAQERVMELEGIIKEFLEASYIYESENGAPTDNHKGLVRRAEALTPPATEEEER